jgi:hypothetical protein
MGKLTPELKTFARSFVVYQAGQPGGLSSSKNELETCYGLFVTIQPPGTLIPPFNQVLTVLKRIRLIQSRTNDTIIFTKRA